MGRRRGSQYRPSGALSATEWRRLERGKLALAQDPLPVGDRGEGKQSFVPCEGNSGSIQSQ